MQDDEQRAIVRQGVQVGEAGGLVDESEVTLALYAEALEPSSVSRLLGVEPTASHTRGERRKHTGTPYLRGAWFLTVKGVAPVGPDDLLASLFQRLPDEPGFWDSVRAAYDGKLVVGLVQRRWNRGFELGAATMALVARTGLPIEFDLYFDGEQEG